MQQSIAEMVQQVSKGERKITCMEECACRGFHHRCGFLRDREHCPHYTPASHLTEYGHKA